MSFAEFETSRFGGKPVELFRFTYGAGVDDYYAWTDAERVVFFDGVYYQPVPIQRGKLTENGGRERKDLTITISAKSPLVSMFYIYPPDQAITLAIRVGHLDDPANEFLPLWTGRVLNVKEAEDGTAAVTCRPLVAATKQTGLRRHYQLGCPHNLYGGKCKADQAAATQATTASAVSYSTVTLAAGWNGARPVAKFLGGMLTWTKQGNPRRRTILRIAADNVTVTLAGSTDGLEAGAAVSAVLGCNHQMGDCQDLHANIHNYGGQPWIPFTNPVNTNPYY